MTLVGDERITEKPFCPFIRYNFLSWWTKCSPADSQLLTQEMFEFCYMLEAVLDHQRQRSCAEGEVALQSRGFCHGRMGLAEWGGVHWTGEDGQLEPPGSRSQGCPGSK